MNAPYTILIIEDDASISELLELTLLSPLYVITRVDNGAQAITALTKGIFDLVVLDILIPPPDGWEIYRAIRTNPRMKETKVVIITALGFKPEYLEAKKISKADIFMQKPFELNELRETVKNMLDKR